MSDPTIEEEIERCKLHVSLLAKKVEHLKAEIRATPTVGFQRKLFRQFREDLKRAEEAYEAESSYLEWLENWKATEEKFFSQPLSHDMEHGRGSVYCQRASRAGVRCLGR